jgi:hypothetical protein
LSTVFDVASVSVDGGTALNVIQNAIEITIQDATTTPNVELTVQNEVGVVEVTTPGPQGPAGLQNVYVQATDPSKDSNGDTVWGSAETNYIWIPV